jgi:arabinose-5-phosphate isomerase
VDEAAAFDMVADFREVLANERQALDLVIRHCAAEPATVVQACEILRGHGSGRRERRVIVSGIGKAGLIARKVAATLSSTGTAAAFIHPVEALHGDLGFVQPDDCAVLMSYSGETVELIRLADELRRLNCPIIAITKSRSSTLGKLSTACLETGEVQEACHLGLAPTSSTTVMLALGDALAIAVAKANGFREEDFARNHPAGALGLRFRAVRGVMRTGNRVVCVDPEMKIKEVVQRVSAAKVGAAVLVRTDGTLLGIFTDGDLRRALLQGGDVLEQAVGAYSSMPCRYVLATDRVSDAMKVFQNTKTEELPALDNQKHVVGVLCLKDIQVF